MRTKGPTARTLHMFWKWGRGYFISYTLMTTFQTIIPFFTLWMSAELVTALYEGREQKEVVLLIIIALSGNLFSRVMSALFTYFVGKEQRLMENREKHAFNAKVLSMDYNKLEDPELRTLRRKIVTNAYINWYGPKNMLESVKDLIRVCLNLLFSLIFFTEMMIKILGEGLNGKSILLLLGILIALVTGVLWNSYANKKKAEYWNEQGQKLLEGNRLGSAIPQNNKDIRIFRMIPFIKEMSNRYNKEYKTVMLKTNLGVFRILIPAFIINTIPEVCAYLLVCLYYGLGVFEIGGIIKYVGYIQRFIQNINALLSDLVNFKINRPYLETYLEFFDIPNDMYQGSLSVEKRSDLRYEVQFKNVSFQYPGSDSYALKNINFTFKVGQRLAVVGMNGSGKTTLIKLLCRLYDPTEGEIIMNDFNIRKYDYLQFINIFSVVFQDYNLLSLSLGSNVATDGSYDAKKVEGYLREVGFGERLDTMPNGLETALYKNFDEDGVEISGGEAQKIALARALYKDAPFIILDEPTAALDPLAEAEIYSKFNDIIGSKSAIYISHRLSSCRFCDKILVLDQGEIVQFGTHEELVIDEKGKYYELWHAQAQYYTEKQEEGTVLLPC